MPQPIFINFLAKLTVLEQAVSEITPPADPTSHFFKIKQLVSETIRTLRRLMNENGWAVGFIELISQARGEQGFSNRLKQGLMDGNGKNLIINDAASAKLVKLLLAFLDNPLPLQKPSRVPKLLYNYAVNTEREKRNNRKVQLQEILTAYDTVERERNDPTTIVLAPLDYLETDKKLIEEFVAMIRFDVGDPTQKSHLEQAFERTKKHLLRIESRLAANIARNQQIIFNLTQYIDTLTTKNNLTTTKLAEVRQKFANKSFKLYPEIVDLLPSSLVRLGKMLHNHSQAWPIKIISNIALYFNPELIPLFYTPIIAKLESEQNTCETRLAKATTLKAAAVAQTQQATEILTLIQSLKGTHFQTVAAQLVIKLEKYAATEARFLSGLRHFCRWLTGNQDLHAEKIELAKDTATKIKEVLAANENGENKSCDLQLKTNVFQVLQDALQSNTDAEVDHRGKPKGWITNELAEILSTGQRHLLLAQEAKEQTPLAITQAPVAQISVSPSQHQ